MDKMVDYIQALEVDDEAAFRALEDNVMARFTKELARRFPSGVQDFDCKSYAGTSLGAQDQSFADYLLAANARFGLIEFKASFKAIKSEQKKPLRCALFKQLSVKDDMLKRSLDMHYVCWGSVDTLIAPELGEVHREAELLSQYATKVGRYMGLSREDIPVVQYNASTFLDDFLDSHLLGGNLERFEVYVNELAALAEGVNGDGDTIEGAVVVFVPGNVGALPQYMELRFKGLKQLAKFLDYQSPTLEFQRRKQRELEYEEKKSDVNYKGLGL